MEYISTKFHVKKYSGQYQSYREDTIFIRKISKGHNSVKNVGGVSVLVLCISSDDGLYLYQVPKISLTVLSNGEDIKI